jgi:hypothetical protein
MLDEIEGSKQSGRFTISPGRDVYGELTLAGHKTSLYLQDTDFFDTHAIPGQCVKGILQDLTKVSLIRCISSGAGTSYRGSERYYFASVFPHYVIYGDRQIGPDEKVVAEVDFVVDDASALFYDFDAFGMLMDARPFIEQIVHANVVTLGRPVRIGPDPQILYFAGKSEIFAVETILGRVSASHSPVPDLGASDGVRLRNKIFVTITFKEGVAFEDAISRIFTLLMFLGTVAGRPQDLLSLSLKTVHDSDGIFPLRIYWSMPPKRNSSNERKRSHSAEVLLNAVEEPEMFSRVLASWLERQEERRDARARFDNSFAKQWSYEIDRLIGDANMFDILPSSAAPPDVELSGELRAAKKAGQEIFEKLEPSRERDSILGAFGRLGKSSLKQKIRHRAQLVVSAAETQFPEILTVTDEAVNCRNHYVHGSEPRFDYNANFSAVIFFTDTLEFVFAASDLIEAGWDLKGYCQIPSSMSHPFSAYRVNYPLFLQKLKALLPPRVVASRAAPRTQ